MPISQKNFSSRDNSLPAFSLKLQMISSFILLQKMSLNWTKISLQMFNRTSSQTENSLN